MFIVIHWHLALSLGETELFAIVLYCPVISAEQSNCPGVLLAAIIAANNCDRIFGQGVAYMTINNDKDEIYTYQKATTLNKYPRNFLL